MKIHQNNGKCEILYYTPDAERAIEAAGRTCYRSEKKITADSADQFIRTILYNGHLSVLEHAFMTVRFSNVSRGFSHEIVRHRLASFSQESTRYVKQNDLNIVLPPHKDATQNISVPYINHTISLNQVCEIYEAVYNELLNAHWKAEDARQFLPIGLTTEIVMTANFREWMHIFELRCHKRAHWEIRTVMRQLLTECINHWPAIFDHLTYLFTEELEAK